MSLSVRILSWALIFILRYITCSVFVPLIHSIKKANHRAIKPSIKVMNNFSPG